MPCLQDGFTARAIEKRVQEEWAESMVIIEGGWLSYATSLGALGCRPRCSKLASRKSTPDLFFALAVGSQHWQVTSVSVPDLGAVTRGTLSCLASHVQPQIGKWGLNNVNMRWRAWPRRSRHLQAGA